MLTATYSMVAIDVERDKARGILHRLHQYLQAAWKGLQDIDFSFLDTIFHKLTHLHKYCRRRKIEVHLIPTLRRASMEAHALLAELDALNARCEGALHTAATHLGSIIETQSVKASEICNAMDLYCNNLFLRLDKEETELLPLAQRLLSVEEWFAIGAQFLADDADAAVRRRQSKPCLRSPEREPMPGLN